MKRKLLSVLAIVVVVMLSMIVVSCDDENRTMIETQGLSSENNVYKTTVSSKTESFDILSKIKFDKKAEFVLSFDKEFSDTFTNGKLSLKPGDNVVYLKVTDKNENESIYTFNIYQKKLVTVAFNPNGGIMANTVLTVEEGSTISNPSAEKVGHSLKWDYNFDKPITSDITINAIWTPYDSVISADVDGQITRYEVQFGQVPGIPAPEKIGFKFTGWKYGDVSFNPNVEFTLTDKEVSIVATFEPITYEIEYVIDSSVVTNNKDNLTTFTVVTENGEEFLVVLAAPTHSSANYEFIGWCTDSTLNNIIDRIDINFIEASSNEKISLYPKWKVTSTVTYNAGEGKCDKSEDLFVYGEDYALAIPSRDNYIFDGWLYDGQMFVNAAKWNYTTDIELVAKWTPRENDISYVLGYDGAVNDENNPKSFNVEDEDFTLLPATFDSKHKFLGWYSQPSFAEGTEVYSITADLVGTVVTLYAKWEVTSTVAFDVNGGQFDTSSLDIIYGDTYLLGEPTKDRYRFDGWYCNDKLVALDGVWPYDIDVLLVAKWTPESYTINYELNGGSFAPEEEYPTSFTVESLAEELALSTPFKNFSVFAGWYLDAAFEQKIESIDPLQFDGNITLYANWDTAKLTVNYDAQGGSILKTQDLFELGVLNKLQETIKPGYRFDGWYDGDNKIDSTIKWENTEVLELNLVAHWTLLKYTIEYDLGGASGDNISFIYEYDVNSDPITLPTLSKSNSYFVGWSLDGGSPNRSVVIPKGSTGNRSYVAIWASDKGDNGLLYSMVDGNMVVVGIDRVIDSSIKGGIVIPATHGGKPVVAIDTGAFEEFGKAFTKTSYANMSDSYVTFQIPTSISRVGANAFAECNGIKVTLYDESGAEADYQAWDKTVSWESGNISARDCIWGFRPAIGWTRYSMVKIPDDYE